MGVESLPFFGFGYMLRKSDVYAEIYDPIYDELLENDDLQSAQIASVWSDVYCGEWIFVGVAMHGDSEEIQKVDLPPWMMSNGGDLHIELRSILGRDHPFLKHAVLGIYFGTDYT